MRSTFSLTRQICSKISVVFVLPALMVWVGGQAEAQSGFTGMVKPLDCANYIGTDADYSTSYSTLYRDNENGDTAPYYEGKGSHPGVDVSRLSNGQGDVGAPVKAIYDGVVASVLYEAISHGHGWGNCLIIEHTNVPDAGTIYSCYAHMSGFNGTWAKGQSVSKGQVIGYVGTTGNSTGPHLHFQIDKDYSDYSGFHPWFPTSPITVNTPDSNGDVLRHTINPMKFVQDHMTVSGGSVDPANPYVDGSYGGTQVGTAANPFKTVAQAISVASTTQATVHIKPGTYSEKVSTSKHIHFVTWGNGTVRIGG